MEFFICCLGLTKDGSSIPSDNLKAEFLKLLESDKGHALEVLSKELKIDTIQYATVCELVSSHEEHFGQLSLDNWKNIFQQLGYLDDFYRVSANQTALMAAAADTPMESQPVDNQQHDQSLIDKSSAPRGITGTGERTNDGSKASANGEFLSIAVNLLLLCDCRLKLGDIHFNY